MSTLGGNKGERERNPNKPKFAALDINSLYRTSRGESFEPATQKNAAPRKHGMQSLGKVPSARRPPANLPSLKAETSTPANSTQAQTTEQQQQSTNNSSSASWADSSSSGAGGGNNSANSSNTAPTGSSNAHSGASQVQSSSVGAATNSSANSSSSTWSAVAIGNVKEETLPPPLYQSPQFQNEFPSLGDGGGTAQMSSSTQVTSNANASSAKMTQNSFDSGGMNSNVNLRPSTDVASWMQQQQSNSANSGSARGGGGENGGQASGNFTPTADLNGPPTVMALMPSFLRGSGGGGSSGIANISSSSGTNHMNLIQKSTSGGGGGNSRGDRDRGNARDRYGGNSSSYNNDYVNNNMAPRHHRQQQQQAPRLSGRQQNYHHQQQQTQQPHNNNNNNNSSNSNDDRSSSYEPEVIQQRPIIREEELERIDSLARDDAWSKHDEIDYNKKLQFSDDEAEDVVKPKEMISMKTDAWRDSEKREMKQQQNGPRSIDPLYVEKMKMVRDEEDRKERERKSAAQRKLQELDEKSKHQPKMINQDIDEKMSSGIGYTINDADKRDNYNNNSKSKYINDKYDYDYGRNQAGSGAEFKKSSFQSNLPPRFQKQHNIDRRDDDRRPMEKSSASSTSSSYKPLHQQDSKNVPFAQQPAYEQRWIQYNKANQQGPPPRRNMSSLSQSSSDDNRGGTSNKQPSYNRRRHESEEDDYGRYGGGGGGKDLKTQSHQKISSSTLSSAQITRSMSDSSEKLSDHNRSEKSTSREYLGSNVCWAEACEQSDKRSTIDVGSVNVSRDRRRVSESSAMSDDQPRTILQRNKPLQEQLQGKTSVSNKEKENIDDDKKTVLNEGPPSKISASESDEKKKEKSAEPSLSVEPKKSLEIIPEKEQNANDNKFDDGKEAANKKESSKEDDRHSSKRSPRYESSSSSRGGGRGNYGGGSYRGNWGNARRGGHSRGGNRYDYSDSEEEEGYEGDWNRKNSSGPRKDLHHRRGVDSFGQNSGGQKEGFSPRGEPSRRGRGASSSFHRNSNSINAPGKSRIDNYGPPSSKSPFGSNDEKSSSEKKVEATKEATGNKEKLSDDDRIKQKQKALSDGLMNKNMKDNSNVALQKTSDDSTTAKHSTEQQPSTDQKEKKTPEDDKASNDSKRSSSSYNANNRNNNNNNRHDKNSSVSTSAPSSAAGKTIAKPVSSSSTTTQHPPVSSSHFTSSSMLKPQDSRGGNNNNGSNYRGNVNAAASGGGGGRQDNNNRMSSAPRFTNKGGNGSNRIGGGNSYWEANKNHPESIHDDKMSLMQQLNASNQSLSQQQQQQMSSNMMGKSEQVIKQQQQQQSMQQANQQNQAAMLDGASLPKTTLIFENTSLRSGPPQSSNPAAVSNTQGGMKRPNVSSQQQSQMQASMGQQQQQQKEAVTMGTTTINEMIEQQSKEQSLSSALQNLSFAAGGNAGNHPSTGGQQQKNDMVDMNSFKFSFDTQISLTDDSSFGQSSASHPSQTKTSSLGLVGAKTGGGNNILNTDSLNMKVASCKKVWEEASDHNTVVGNSAEDVMANFVAQQHIQQYNNMSSHSHHTGLSPQSFGYNTGSSNDHSSSLVEQHFVNKVNDNDDGNSYPSPQQHMNAHVMHSQSQQQANLNNMKAAEAFATTANVCKVKPTQMHPSGLSPPPQMPQQNQMQHQQTFYPTPNYPNMPTIPSPPVVYNSQATASGLYSYNMDARTQMYGYPTASAGANNSLSFNAFMQASAAPTHEVYQNLSQYRAAVQPYNQTPQLNNPNAVLISSATSNSMMGSKTNSQQIGAIGSKSSAPPQSGPSAAAAGTYNQQYMNHLYHQQHANSYYPNSTAQQANPYYNTSGSAATGSYGMFGGTSAPHGQQQMPNYGSVGQFPLNSQMLNNLVVNQQYRSGHVVNASNSNGASGTSGSGSNAGAASNAGSGGYMNNMKQQHQSQLQDNQVKHANMSDSHNKMYDNWDSYNNTQNQQFPFTISPIQRPSTHYQQQRPPKSSNSSSSMMSSNQGSKSQYFIQNNHHMSGSKREN